MAHRGELAADVRQTRDIEILFNEMADALEAIDANNERIHITIESLEERVRDIETENQ